MPALPDALLMAFCSGICLADVLHCKKADNSLIACLNGIPSVNWMRIEEERVRRYIEINKSKGISLFSNGIIKENRRRREFGDLFLSVMGI